MLQRNGTGWMCVVPVGEQDQPIGKETNVHVPPGACIDYPKPLAGFDQVDDGEPLATVKKVPGWALLAGTVDEPLIAITHVAQ